MDIEQQINRVTSNHNNKKPTVWPSVKTLRSPILYSSLLLFLPRLSRSRLDIVASKQSTIAGGGDLVVYYQCGDEAMQTMRHSSMVLAPVYSALRFVIGSTTLLLDLVRHGGWRWRNRLHQQSTWMWFIAEVFNIGTRYKLRRRWEAAEEDDYHS
jgi:hypothetical protein